MRLQTERKKDAREDFEIAKRFGLSINELLEINNLDGYILRKNMILRLKKD